MDISALIPIGIGALRSVTGWLENALEDGKISKIELAQLSGTVMRILVLSVGLYYGLGSLGIDIDLLGSSMAAWVVDFVTSKVTK